MLLMKHMDQFYSIPMEHNEQIDAKLLDQIVQANENIEYDTNIMELSNREKDYC